MHAAAAAQCAKGEGPKPFYGLRRRLPVAKNAISVGGGGGAPPPPPPRPAPATPRPPPAPAPPPANRIGIAARAALGTFADLHHQGVNVVLAADRHGIAQVLGDLADDIGCRQRRIAAARLQRQRQGQHAGMPGAKVLGAEVLTGDLVQIGIHMLGAQLLALARIIHILEQPLARQVLAAPHDARDARVLQLHLLLHAALAFERQPDARCAHRHMAVAQGRQPKRAVLARIAVVANAQRRGVQKADYRCRHRGLRGIPRFQVALDAPSNQTQLGRKGRHALELGLLALLLPQRVVAVLLAPPGIAARRLQVALRIGADPHIGVGGGNDQEAYALELARVADGLPALVLVDKPVAALDALPAGRGIGDISQRLLGFDHVVLLLWF